jgi:hypothetical protein
MASRSPPAPVARDMPRLVSLSELSHGEPSQEPIYPTFGLAEGDTPGPAFCLRPGVLCPRGRLSGHGPRDDKTKKCTSIPSARQTSVIQLATRSNHAFPRFSESAAPPGSRREVVEARGEASRRKRGERSSSQGARHRHEYLTLESNQPGCAVSMLANWGRGAAIELVDALTSRAIFMRSLRQRIARRLTSHLCSGCTSSAPPRPRRENFGRHLVPRARSAEDFALRMKGGVGWAGG